MTTKNPIEQRFIPQSIATIAFAAVLVVGFFPTLASLHQRWSEWTESYSHGYLLLGVGLYLYFDSTHRAPVWLPNLQRAAIWILATLSLAWLVAYASGIGALQQLLVVCIAAALLAAMFDRDRFWRALLPLGLVLLAIPIWDELLAKPLQLAATAVSGWAVTSLFGIPTKIDGFHISIPAGTFEIASGCAGLVFLLSAIALGIVYGQFFLVRKSTRAVAVVAAAALGIAINWLRIISLILIGQYSAMQHSLITDGHLLYGWYLFSGALAIILLISHFVIAPQPRVASGAALTPLRYSWTRFAAILLALSCGPLLLLALRSSENPPAQPSASISAYLKQASPVLTGFIEPAVNISYAYLLEPDLTVSFVYYSNSLGKGKLIGQSNRLLTNDESIIDETILNPMPPLPARRQLHVRKDIPTTALKRNGAPALLIWDWYEIGATPAATAVEGKWQQLRQMLHGAFGGFYIRLQLSCREVNCTIEQQILSRHAAAVYRELRPELDRIVDAQ